MIKIIKRKWIIAVLAAAILAGAYFWFFKKPDKPFSDHNETKIGWVTDIHADRFKKRNVDSGLLYPRKYKEYLPKVFDAMRAEGITAVIATGDNTNSGDDNYARDILRIANEKKMDMLWAKGNHDSEEAMSVLGFDAHNYYYFRDFGETRIIVLDDTEYEKDKYDYFGRISPEQFEWIREALKTEKQIIIAMHIPMFNEDKLLDRYIDLEKLFHESGNVRIVIAGHYHIPWQKEYDGIKYYVEGALTRGGEEGAYAEINLENYAVEYKFAK